MTPEEVTAKATQLANELIADARTLEGPIIWVTGNLYMPPMRSFPVAEEVWEEAWSERQFTDGTPDPYLWELFCETVEDELSRSAVIMESPDYDNSLYVVDLSRWEYDINSEWKRRIDGP